MIALSEFEGARLILVGGASGSGKSHFASFLRRKLTTHSLFRQDWVYNGIRSVLSSPAEDEELARSKMLCVIPAIISDAARGDECLIIEGGWIGPAEWKNITDNMQTMSVFFGYPDATPDAIIERLSGTGHWLRTTPQDAEKFIKDEIVKSKADRDFIDSQNTQISKFIDVSDGFLNFLQ